MLYRLLAFSVLSTAILMAGLLIQPRVSLAQDKEDGAAAKAAAKDDAAKNKEGAADAKKLDDKPATEMPTSLLGAMLKALGWSYSIIFLILSFLFVALVVMNMLTARRTVIVPPALIEGFEAHVNENRLSEAFELVKADDSILGRMLSAGLAKLQLGYEKAMAAMQEEGSLEIMRLEHRLSYIALIATVSPMVGLYGTVDGMIDAFQLIATKPTQPTPGELSEGIAKALWTTLVGLFIAIPALAAYNLLRNRVSRLVLETGIVSENLMSRFQPPGKA